MLTGTRIVDKVKRKDLLEKMISILVNSIVVQIKLIEIWKAAKTETNAVKMEKIQKQDNGRITR